MNKVAIFEGKRIRRVWHQKDWWFSVVDICEVLSGSPDPGNYWRVLKSRLKSEGSQIITKCNGLKMLGRDNKHYLTDAAPKEIIFRLVQSIPSPKAEPFKLWLARLGRERIEEIENPELAQERMKILYEQKGYPKDWIDKRLRGIAIRQDLTDEWKERGVALQKEFAILTAEISKATFGMTPSQYKKHKNIPTKSKLNLRDNMTDLELIFTMLGERVTTEISQKEKPNTFVGNKRVAKRGGNVAGKARKNTEKEIGRSVVSKTNFLGSETKIFKGI